MNDELLLMWVPLFMLLLVIEFVFACLVFKLSKLITFFLASLIAFQLAAASLLFSEPKPPVSWELGGADLRGAFVAFFGFWGTVLVWVCCVIATVLLYIGKRRRSRP